MSLGKDHKIAIMLKSGSNETGVVDNWRYWCRTAGMLGFQQLPCGVIVRGNSAGLQNAASFPPHTRSA